MNDERYHPGPATWSAVLAAGLLFAYCSAYFAMVQPREGLTLFLHDPIPVIASYSGGLNAGHPRASRTDKFLDRSFAPIHWLDREILRPARWAPVLPEGIR